ncbi:hypothetical protein NLX86_04910 [Streptomyces sp. A3M-1-3]|uniref:hypothetical protein n=1 Tax=Streptomyces sp. A3M-1-3 TaxID=2962044 RepID=UPI0020B67744|nr:hypothetical protein [Streptomyces sp. A3M-1-3]MCP3817499.1 hypothetical protein [Streptomyces sp. A3M-1-3]
MPPGTRCRCGTNRLNSAGFPSGGFWTRCAATATGGTIRLSEHDAHLWADHTGQEIASSAVRTVLAIWSERAA